MIPAGVAARNQEFGSSRALSSMGHGSTIVSPGSDPDTFRCESDSLEASSFEPRGVTTGAPGVPADWSGW